MKRLIIVIATLGLSFFAYGAYIPAKAVLAQYLINDEMKIACAQALAALAREDVPDEVAMAYGQKLTFGREYIIPTPFDPRLIYRIPPAVAKAGIDTGAARRPRTQAPQWPPRNRPTRG